MRKVQLLASVAVSVLVISGPAMAGFKWEPSVKTHQAEEKPVAAVVTEELAPVTELTPQEIVTAIEPEIEIAALAPEATPREVVQGFGRDVPLSYALTSIVPSKYGYAFGADVNPAMPISWKGGESWDAVLEAALESEGLFAHIDDNKVSVQTVAPVKEGSIPSVKTSRAFAPSPEEETLGLREVIVRRGSGAVESVDAETVEAENAEPEIVEAVEVDATQDDVAGEIEDVIADTAPVDILESSVELDTSDTAEEVSEPVIVERINPDIPAEVASYVAPSSDENVFEMVVNERAPSQVLDTKKISSFHAKAGQTVRGTLEKWSEDADVQLYWETPYDFPVEKSMALAATYPMAVQALLGRFENVEPRPTVKLHPNWPHGPSILTVK